MTRRFIDFQKFCFFLLKIFLQVSGCSSFQTKLSNNVSGNRSQRAQNDLLSVSLKKSVNLFVGLPIGVLKGSFTGKTLH